jgi:hypothetical protein
MLSKYCCEAYVLLLKCLYEGVRVLLSRFYVWEDTLSEIYYHKSHNVQQLIATIEECVVAKSSFPASSLGL